MAWTEERVTVLRSMWADGCSGEEIARRLGGITRNAVIGKVHRLGLSGRKLTPQAARNLGTRKARKRRFRFPDSARTPAQIAQEAAHAAKIRAEFDALIASGEPDIPPGQRRTLLIRKPDGKLYANEALSEKACRWAYGEPGDYHFCGQDKVSGLPYCKAHARRAFAGLGQEADHPRYIRAIRDIRLMDVTRALDAFDEMAEKGDQFRVKEPEKA